MDRSTHGGEGVNHSLNIHSAEVLSASGAASSFETVFCPVQGHSVSVESCVSCPDFIGIVRDEPPTTGGHRQATRSGASVACRTAASAAGPLLESDLALRTPVSAAMTTDVVCVRDDLSVETLTTLLLDEWIGAVPVVDEHGRPIGIVSKTDLLREAHDRGDPTAPAARRTTVREVMTPLALTLSEQTPLARACARMVLERVHRLPVVDPDGRVVGIFSTTDATRWLAEHAVAQARSAAIEAPAPGVEEIAPISIRAFAMQILWVCGSCGEHYPHAAGCPEQCRSCGAIKQFFYSPTED